MYKIKKYLYSIYLFSFWQIFHRHVKHVTREALSFEWR